jgi:hypothetical protein
MDFDALIQMYRAQLLGQTLREAGFPETPANQAQWDRCALQIAQIAAQGGVVELPADE